VALLLILLYISLFTNTYGEGSYSEGKFLKKDEYDGLGFKYGGFENTRAGSRNLGRSSIRYDNLGRSSIRYDKYSS